MPTMCALDDLATLVEERDLGRDLFVRWSEGPATDIPADRGDQSSRDGLTGLDLPGLSANPLHVQPWWNGRGTRLWVARRLHDYRHLRDRQGPGADVRAWVFVGQEQGRGPDNEPLVCCHEPIAWIADRALAECEELIGRLSRDDWGPLDRRV